MKGPEAPFVELGFYYSGLSDQDAFLRVTKGALQLGARFSGVGFAHHGAGIGRQPFAGTLDLLCEATTIDDLDSLIEKLNDPDVRVVELRMHNIIGTASDVPDILTLLSIPREAMGKNHHPVAVWSGGDMFSGPAGRPGKSQKKRAERAGRHIYKRFLKLVEATDASYAAITVEWPLLCPYELEVDPEHARFRDFFVSEAYLGEEGVRSVAELFSGAYTERTGSGLYVSTYRYFNPDGTNWLADKAERSSTRVAHFIAAAHPGGFQRD